MNIDYRKLFIALVAALILTLPVAAALKAKQHRIDIEKSKSNQLQLDIKSRDQLLEERRIELEKQEKANDKLEREKQQLKKELQAKAERKAAEARLAVARRDAAAGVSGNCSTYRPLVEKYFGAEATPAAMIVMSHESGCNPNAVSPTNDHGLFQLNQIPIYNPEANIKYAYQHKFLTPRRGTKPNFSAWYAVCTPDLVPKYAGVWCI